LVGDLKEGDHFEYLDVSRRVILKWILKTYSGKVLPGFICPKVKATSGLL
jgi:hypothetical protein